MKGQTFSTREKKYRTGDKVYYGNDKTVKLTVKGYRKDDGRVILKDPNGPWNLIVPESDCMLA